MKINKHTKISQWLFDILQYCQNISIKIVIIIIYNNDCIIKCENKINKQK